MKPVFPHPGHSFVAQPFDKKFENSPSSSDRKSPVDATVEARAGASQGGDVSRVVRVNVGKRIL